MTPAEQGQEQELYDTRATLAEALIRERALVEALEREAK